MTQNIPVYNVDVVMCVAASENMLSLARQYARTLRQKADDYFENGQLIGGGRIERQIGDFRVRVIAFGDYACNGENTMQESDFFDLNAPGQQAAFERHVDAIVPMCSARRPNNALEAVALALRSQWTEVGGRYRRHIVMLLTDAPALALQDPACTAAPGYPEGMPADWGELYDLFCVGDPAYAPGFSPRHGRLYAIAPLEQESAWQAMRTWDRVWMIPMDPDTGHPAAGVEELF